MSGSPARAPGARRLLAALGMISAASIAAGGAHAADETALQAPLRLVPEPLTPPARTGRAVNLGGDSGATVTIPAPGAGGIEVNRLDEIAPDSIGVLDPGGGGLGVEMWRGTERAVVAGLLRRLPGDLRSHTMRDLARRLLLSIATPPVARAGEAMLPGSSLLALRLERLAALGEVSGLNRLLAAVPARLDDESIGRLRIDGLLLEHDYDAACRAVRNGIASYHADPYWQQAMIFCHMVSGETDRVMLGLDLLREQGMDDSPAFLALAGTAFGVKATMSGDEVLSPLNFAMHQVTGTPLPPDAVERAAPALLYAIATARAVEPPMRARAAEMACSRGMLDGAVLAAAYEAFGFAPEELANAISAQGEVDGPRQRALLYQAARAETLPSTRAEVLRVALEEAEEAGLYQAAVAAYLPMLGAIDVMPELAWFATTAGRALYAAGRYEQASAWLSLGRQEAILNPQASTAAAALWPYSRLAGGSALTTEGSLSAWRAMRESTGDAAFDGTQALLRATFQALGEQDPMPWSLIAANGAPVARPLPSAALLYALDEASEARRVGETVLLSLVLLGEAGPSQSHTLALGRVLSALGRIGLDDEARSLAIEAALANGV